MLILVTPKEIPVPKSIALDDILKLRSNRYTMWRRADSLNTSDICIVSCDIRDTNRACILRGDAMHVVAIGDTHGWDKSMWRPFDGSVTFTS